MYLTLPVVTGYFWPKLLTVYIVCGVVDVLRTRPWKRETFLRYFMGQGFGTWLTSPFNLLMDVLTLPYRNKGVYKLEDLPPAYQAEVRAVIAAAEESKLSQQLESRMAGCQLGMIFFKWYGRNQNPSIDVPAYNAPFRYIRTIGVSVFNKRKSTSTHFGPLRITLRVLYCLNDIDDPGALHPGERQAPSLARQQAFHLRRHPATPLVQRHRLHPLLLIRRHPAAQPGPATNDRPGHTARRRPPASPPPVLPNLAIL